MAPVKSSAFLRHNLQPIFKRVEKPHFKWSFGDLKYILDGWDRRKQAISCDLDPLIQRTNTSLHSLQETRPSEPPHDENWVSVGCWHCLQGNYWDILSWDINKKAGMFRTAETAAPSLNCRRWVIERTAQCAKDRRDGLDHLADAVV